MSQFDKFAGLYNPTVKLSRRGRRYCQAIKSAASGNPERILDVGGGTGLIASCVAGNGKRVVVLDPSQEMLSRIKDKRVEAIKGFAQEMPFLNNSFDLVLCVNALHHFPNDFERKDAQKSMSYAIEEMLRVLKPTGTMVIIDFDKGRIGGRIMSFFEELAFGSGDRFFSQKGIEALFSKYPVTVQASRLDWISYLARVRKN
jgi:ubiquinone/menaquinone biosynthesis C-methylase UbiE